VGKVFEAADHTLVTDNEAGFACYRGAGNIALSEVVFAENHPAEDGPATNIDLDSVTQDENSRTRIVVNGLYRRISA
jgi:hypothetical protein